MKRGSFITTPFGLVTFGLLLAFLWGSPFPVIKWCYQELGIQQGEIWKQVLFAGYRFFAASLLLFMFYLIEKKKIVMQRNEVLSLCKVGCFQTFLQYFFLYIGLGQSLGMVTSLIAGTGPYIQIVMGHLMFKDDRLTKSKILAIILGLIGMFILFNPFESRLHFGWGEGFVLFGTIAGCYGTMLSKKQAMRFDSRLLTGFQMFVGGIGLIVFGMLQHGIFPFSFGFRSLGMFGYLVFVSAVAFLVLNILFKYYQASHVSIFLSLTPLFGVLTSWILLDEPLRINIFLSLVLIVFGIYLLNRSTPSN